MIRQISLGLLFVLLVCMTAEAGKYNPTLSIGDQAPDWAGLKATTGKTQSLADSKARQVVVIVFTTNSCLYSKDYEQRLNLFVEKWKGQSVSLIAINSNTGRNDQMPQMIERAKQSEFQFPYLYDETQEIAKQYGATYTPEFFVLDKNRRIVYMGAMDDATDAEKVTISYVDQAVEAALAGKLPEHQEIPARGCAIRYNRRRREPK